MSSVYVSANAPREAPALLAIAVFLFYGEVNGWVNHALVPAAPAGFWAADLVFQCVLPFALLLRLRRQFQLGPADYGLKPITRWGDLVGTTLVVTVLASMAYLVAVRLALLFLYVSGRTAWAEAFFAYQAVIPAGPMHLPVVVYFALTAGIFESIIYIGLPWVLWRERFGSRSGWGFTFVSSVLFASIHWEQGVPGAVGALVFGLVACRVYLKVRDLWPIVVAHVLVDLAAFW